MSSASASAADATAAPSSLIPPREGQRQKKYVLPHMNGGAAFQLVEVYAATHGGDLECLGILDGSKANTEHVVHVWKEQAYESVAIDRDLVRAVNLPTPPGIAFESFSAVIGGLGKHTRWKVIMAKRKRKWAYTLFVSHIVSEARFEAFVRHRLMPFAVCDFAYVYHGAVRCTEVCIMHPPDLTMVAAYLQHAGYSVVPVKADEEEAYGVLGIERYDRSEHTWWNQEQQTAGPLRDTHKWKLSFTPEHWRKIPFTWHLLAEMVDVSDAGIGDLPLPLRNYVCEHRAAADPPRSSYYDALRSDLCVTSRLTESQNHQLLSSAYWTMLAPFSDLHIRMALLLQFRYCLFGYLGRVVGLYSQKAQHIGYGAYCREFKNKPQYEYKNLNVAIKNKVTQRDGRLLGNGFKGTRGKRGHSDYPEYRPVNKMKRSIEATVSIREPPYDPFREYARTNGGAQRAE